MKIKRDDKKYREAWHSYKRIPITEAKFIVDLLNQEFGIKAVFKFNNRARAFAKYGSNSITVGLNEPEWVIVHEFAHLLSFRRYGEAGKHHGVHFYNSLKDVATAYYGDMHKYPFICDYASLYCRYYKEFPGR